MFAAYALGALFVNAYPPITPDSLIIFRAGETYQYRAAFINPAGDTLTQGSLTLEATGAPWTAQRKTQTAIRIHYHYTAQDSITFLAYPDPTTKRPDKPKRYSWARTHVTGAIENRQKVWIHPFRDNQYVHTEIAPFPELWLDSLRSGGQWFNQTTISVGWGKFIGSVRSTYQVVHQETRQYGALSLPGCWLIKSVATHDKLSNSYLDFYFHPQYGFTEMHYRFFDGTRISFALTQVTSRAKL